MPNFEGTHDPAGRFADRFPPGSNGLDILGDLTYQSDYPSLHQTLGRLKGADRPSAEVHTHRVFIPHRRCDAAEAKAIADIARQVRYEVWMDIEDPVLANFGTEPDDEVRRALVTAIHFEIALLNCSHLITLMTPGACDSMWVPYAYGRVQVNMLDTWQVAVRLYDRDRAVPQALCLGRRLYDPSFVLEWLARSVTRPPHGLMVPYQ